MSGVSSRAAWMVSGVLSSLLASAASSHAQVNNAGTFKNLTHEQTGPTTVIATGAFFNAEAFFDSPGQFDTAILTYPGAGSPAGLPLVSPTEFLIGPSFPTQAAMDAAYPFGSYTFTVSGALPTAIVTVGYTADAYTTDIPQLTATSFNALAGLSTNLSSLTLGFNAFTPSPLATAAFTYFTIFGTSQGCSGLSPSATSCAIDPQALAPGTTYDWELDFSDRIESTQDINGSPVLTYTDFDVRTDGVFTTSVPEASTWAMLLIGFVGLGCGARLRTGRKPLLA
jgi:hypothetical protein